ncbi:MAG: PAS domain S-box protein [Methanomicrobiales archaeon]|nr:PAS domain S-box protein [Methanomicrobiales archaeon]
MNGTHFEGSRFFWWVAIGLSVMIAVSTSIVSLMNGIYDVYPFLYFLPIILFIYRYPHRGVIFTLIISIVYLLLVYLLSGFNPMLVAISTAWFVIFVTIGVVTSSFAEGMKSEEQKYRGIFENSQAGIFTFDLGTRQICEMNSKCARLLSFEQGDLQDKDISRIIPPSEDFSAFIQELRQERHTSDHELRFTTRDGSVRQFVVSASLSEGNIAICSIIDVTERRLAEKVIQKARDELEDRVKERTDELLKANEVLKAELAERRRFESAIQLANRKLSTLSSITRHDILNQVSAIVMYLSIAQEEAADPQLKEHLQKIDEITHLIQRQIRFTRDYQNIGSNAPSWLQVDDVIHEAAKDMNLHGIRLETDLDGLEIYADSLLGKVFSSLLDNSHRHGGHATLVRITSRQEEDHLVIVYEDNGIGIPEVAKAKIFRREYYRNTGYGLFLSEEILSITGTKITETGTEGQGARFEIHVPKGMFRFPG